MDGDLLRTMTRWSSVRLGFCLALSLLSLAGCRPATPVSRSPDPTADHDTPEPLPDPDPVAFLEKCLERYNRQDIRGYRAILHKRERIDGQLNPPEEIEIWYRAHPRSVFMHWLQGARRAESILYVEGEYGAKILVHPSGMIGRIMKEVSIDPDSPAARQAGRYNIKDFGLREALERTVRQWQVARERGELRVEYLGVKRVPETGDRRCDTLRRTFAKPEEDGVTEATIFVDHETWFQVGTVLRGESGTLIGEYMYRDIQLNPPFDRGQFEPSALIGRAVK
jgi:hypothetical protein